MGKELNGTDGRLSEQGQVVHQQISSDSVLPREDEKPRRWYSSVLDAGSAAQIVIAAIIAIAIGMAVTASVDSVPEAVPELVEIPGNLWLRALRAVVLPLIICSMILAVQSLREMARGGGTLAKFTVIYYLCTTVIAIVHSIIMVDLVWSPLFTVVGPDSLAVDEDDQELYEEREAVAVHDVIVSTAESFIPQNIVDSLATDGLLAVVITSIVVGYLIERDGALLRATREVERIVMKIVTALIKMAPIGVFFLVLANLMRLELDEMGENMGILIGSSLTGLSIHVFIIIPFIFFCFMRENPYAYWIKCAPAWITAWGTASSAGTMPVTLRMAKARGIPQSVRNFVIPLGTLINMDGTAIYFPCTVAMLAVTQGITLNAGDYVIICLLSTLASIGATPIPSSSLVLTVMIAGSVNVPITGMYAVVIAIDWFIDRFRTATNVSGDLYAVKIVTKLSKVSDADFVEEEEAAAALGQENLDTERKDNTERV